MFPLRLLLAALYSLSIWTTGYGINCGVRQIANEERCCDMCHPGTYVSQPCSQTSKTECRPCVDGFFSNEYTFFDRCEECRSCQHGYAEKCTLTTDAKCSCPHGFLCSDDVCSACVENKIVTKEEQTTPGTPTVHTTNQICPEKAYFDVKDKHCKPWKQCSALGLAELSPGNKTHNSICDVRAMVHSKGGGPIHVTVYVSLLLMSLSLLVFLFSVSIKKLRRIKANKNPVLAIATNTDDYQLSKEESGLQVFIQDESKDSNSSDELHVGNVMHL